jgi:hypothetical protein
MFAIEMCRAFLAVLGGACYGPGNMDFVGKCRAEWSIVFWKLEIEYLKIGILQKRKYLLTFDRCCDRWHKPKGGAEQSSVNLRVGGARTDETVLVKE